MLGAIAGDIIGSVHEFLGRKTRDFSLFVPDSTFTDDTVLTIAVADSLMTGTSYVDNFHRFTHAYPGRGYGSGFHHWVMAGSRNPYNSWGNGSAMRVSPVAYAFNSLPEVLKEAEASAAVTHNHPEGIRGAQATALAIFLARNGESKAAIRSEIRQRFGYDLSRTVDEIQPSYAFNESCQHTVPQAIISFLDASDYEDTIRNAISLGGDADTLACIAGGIAGAFYGVPKDIADQAWRLLEMNLRAITATFMEKFYDKK
jgi:ADP-ribosylglycohydrolase